MADKVTAAAIYARISRDIEGTGLGVKRQIEDCQRLADSLGWTVAEEYVDNDLSAYSGKKPRPSFQRMLADITDGLRDAVIVYHVDRLTRRPAELEEFLSALDGAKVRQVRFVSGNTDLGTGDGLFVTRVMAAMAANESATKSRRIRRKIEQNVAEGKPNGGANRPFGYERDKITVRQAEAEIYRALAERYLAGESLRSLATWLTETEVATSTGAQWKTPTLRGMLINPRYAGLRTHQGQVAGRAAWDAIISEDTHRRVLARFDSQARSGRRAPRNYLLTGLLRCGKCGNTLYSARRETTRRYVCSSGPDHGGCGRLTVVADPLERLLADAVILRLDTTEMADALSEKNSADARTAAIAEELSEDRTQLDELAEAYARKDISMREWQTARTTIDARIQDHERRLSRATKADALAGLVGNGDALRGQWATLNLDRQVAIVRAVLDCATIGPGVSGARSLDIDRVVPQWRHL